MFKDCGDACKNCFKTEESKRTESEESTLKRKKSYSGTVVEAQFCAAAFVPECVRKMIKERDEAAISPFKKTFSALVLACEIPAIAEVIDFYSVSINFSSHEVAEDLNEHVSQIVKCFSIEEGDVMAFEAGVIQCIWFVNEDDDIQKVTQKVIHAAVYVQQMHGETDTKLGKAFKNLIGVAYGDIEVYVVGSAKKLCVAVGNPVKEAYHALSQCGKKEVVVSREIWQTLPSTDKYKYQTLPDEFVTIYSTEEELSLTHYFDEKAKMAELEELEERFGKELLKYVHPLHANAKTTLQIQMLSSMTQIVSVVVMIQNFDLNSEQQLHEMIEQLLDIVETRGGIIKSVICNPSIVVYAYFGYPGFKHGDDPVRAVLCAQNIFQTLRDKGLEVSVGVSSSTAFCGMLGPQIRLLRCVLGMAVCIAFKLAMQASEPAILCCINTFFLTRRILGEIFTPVRKKMKTLKSTFASAFFEVHLEAPKPVPSLKCIGRSEEKEEIIKVLQGLKNELDTLEKSLPLVIITGKVGIGKSAFMKWLMFEMPQIGFDLTAQVENLAFEEPYENAWKVVKAVLNSAGMDNDERILNLLGDGADEYPIHLLNKMFRTSFPTPPRIFHESDTRRLMVTLVKECVKTDALVIGLDNAEHTGSESWLLLQDLLITHTAIVVATFTEEFNSTVPFVKHILKQKYFQMDLQKLNANELGTLACYVLNVQAIHKSFLEFFEDNSEGNALRLHEILMIPPLQKHFCIVPYISVTEKTLQKKFHNLEETNLDRTKAMVCDVLDPEGMKAIVVPSHLLDVVKDHSTGLNPEEQMLVRKCALLGNTFGLNILEAVCPEYPTNELRCKIATLMKKNILYLQCFHLQISEFENRSMLVRKEIPLEFCPHTLRFTCEYLRKSILNVMPESQKERLHLYLADLLRVNIRCDTCKLESEVRRSSMYTDFVRNFCVPFIDLRLCRCRNIKTQMCVQIEYHLDQGNGTADDRIYVLLEAAEAGLKSETLWEVEKIIQKAKHLASSLKDENDLQPNADKVAIDRLRTELSLMLGKSNDALRHIKHAMLQLNVMFPADIKKKVYKKSKYKGQLLKEETKCLWMGGFVLNSLGDYDTAYQTIKLQLKILEKNGYTFCEIIQSKSLLLLICAKTKPSKDREKTVNRLTKEIRQQCFRRTMDYPVLDTNEIITVVQGFKNVVLIFFEKGELSSAESLAKKCFQLLKLVKYQKELGRLLNLMAYIYFYDENYEKCFEMIGQLQDAFQQSGDVISESHFYSILVTVLRNSNYRGIHKEKIEMCSQYADRLPGLPSHCKYTDRSFCLSAKMALWSCDHNMADACMKWNNKALALQKNIRLNNYFSLSGSLAMLMLDIEQMQKNYVTYSTDEIIDFKNNVHKSLEKIDKSVRDFVPILKGEVKETKQFFEKTMKKCQGFSSCSV